jgi:hypothetical protein
VRATGVRAAAVVAVGIVTGLLWAACTPAVRGASDGVEQQLAGEVTFAVLAAVAGVAIGVLGLLRPGARPVPAAAVLLLGAGAASVAAWGVGRLLGAPVIKATGVLVLMPLTTALVMAAASLVAVLVHPGEPGT